MTRRFATNRLDIVNWSLWCRGGASKCACEAGRMERVGCGHLCGTMVVVGEREGRDKLWVLLAANRRGHLGRTNRALIIPNRFGSPASVYR